MLSTETLEGWNTVLVQEARPRGSGGRELWLSGEG